jgi:hypothetical protein
MIYLFDEGYGCGIVFDGDSITQEQRDHAVKVESVPEPEVIQGKNAILRCNHQTKEVWYDYVDIDINSLL